MLQKQHTDAHNDKFIELRPMERTGDKTVTGIYVVRCGTHVELSLSPRTNDNSHKQTPLSLTLSQAEPHQWWR